MESPVPISAEPSPGRLLQRSIAALLYSALSIAIGYIASFDWLSLDGWIATMLCYSVFIAIATRCTRQFSLFLGFLFGTVAMSHSFWWAEGMLSYTLNMEGTIPRIVFSGMVAWEAIPFAIMSYCISSLYQKRWWSAYLFAIVGFASLGSFWPRVFHWEIGHTLLASLPMAQFAEIGGGPGLSLIVLCGSIALVLIYDGLARRPGGARQTYLTCASIAISVPILAYLLGGMRLAQIEKLVAQADTLTVGCVQDYPCDKQSIERLRKLSDEKLVDVDLLCWPESTLGTHSYDLESFTDMLEVDSQSVPPLINVRPLAGLNQPLLVGGRCFVDEKSEEVPFYQTAYLLDRDTRVLGRYYKRGLMPLGEYVPGEQYFPFLHDWFQLSNYFLMGTDSRPLEMEDGTRLGVLVCYEDTSASLVRATSQHQPDFLVCIINASAFQQSIALEQHLRLGQLRSIENRKFLVRGSGTGITCGVTPTGEIIGTIGADQVGTEKYDVPKLRYPTFYTRFGGWIGVLLAMSLVAIFVAAGRSPRPER